MTKVEKISEQRKKLATVTENESQIALSLVQLDKELAECETSHDSSFHMVKEQKLVNICILYSHQKFITVGRQKPSEN